MSEKFLIFALICVTKCEYSSPSYSVENVYATLDRVTEYFRNLSNAYKVLNDDVWNDINNDITKYMENTSSKRQRRDLQDETQPDKGVNMLQGFQETLSLNVQNVEDIAFFSIQDGDQSLWFAATLNSVYLDIYQLLNGKRIVVHNYSTDILIVVETRSHDIVVLRFGKNRHGGYEIRFKQEFQIAGVAHMNMWLGMNTLYLGIASETKTSIFAWLGEHFDKIDTLFFGARKLLSFQNKSFMHVVAVGFVTKIFRFSVQARRFVEMQKLHHADDISSLYLKKGHFEEHFLVLTGNNFTVLYKEMYNRFVPFQRIAPTKFVHSLIMGNTVVLFCVREDTAEIYQYNGWRFLRLRTKLLNVRRIRQIRSGSEDTLVVQDQEENWKFLRPTWAPKKTWQSLQSEVNVWCNKVRRKIFQRTPDKIPDLKNPVIPSGHIGLLRVQTLNGYSSNELVHLTQRYKNIIAKLNLTNTILAQGIGSVDRSKYTVLHGKKIAVRCNTSCHVRYLKTDSGIMPAAVHKKSEPIDTVRFSHLKVKSINNWKCPVPNLKIDDVLVNGSINGMSMQDLQEKPLKLSGDQEISGKHTFINLHATNASMPLNIATSSTRQIVRMRGARVKELHLTEDEFFLPLNGSTTVMNGSITAPRVTVKGTVHVRSGIRGRGRDKIAPIKEISTPLILSNDSFLQNVTFRNLVQVKDIVSTRGLSLKKVLDNGVPLNSDVPVHLILSSNKTQWNNVTLGSCGNYVTKNSADAVVISGVKFANNITLTDAAYANVPIPKLTIPLCAMGVVTLEIRTSSITMGDLIVKNLNVSRIFGANSLNNTVFDSVSSLQNVDFSEKIFAGQVFVRNASASKIKGTDIRGLNTRMSRWIDANRFKGSVNITRLVVNDLKTPASFNFPLPVEVRDVIMEADSKIGRINNLDMQSFMENVIKVDDIISLEHVTFAHGFTSDHVHASHSTLNLSHLDAHSNLQSKRISTTLETNAINIPQSFGYPASNIPSTFVIQGSANFLTEPSVQNVNNVNLKQLSENLWMLNRDTVVSGVNTNLKNVTLEADTIIDSSFINSLDTKMWSELSKRLLSKTKEQDIAVVSSFKNVEMPAIVAASNSRLRSTDSNLKNVLTNSLMRNEPQIVNAIWRFHELNINDMHWNGELNNINLNTDVVRHDAKQNIVTGEKKILDLTTKDLWMFNMNFSSLVNDAVTKNCHKLSVIKGRKTFNNITLNNLSVKDTIMGRSVETALLKFGNQKISGIKTIQGRLSAPSLITDSVVNDVNLTELMIHQVRKHDTEQVIESKLDFRDDLEIFGNITIGRYHKRTGLKNVNDENELNATLSEATKVMNVAEDVATALQNRAVYASKFETVNENVLEVVPDVSDTENLMDLNSTCLCESLNISALCNEIDMELLNIIINGNSSEFIMKKLASLDGVAFIVTASSDFVSIYSYVIAEERLYKTELYVPGVLQASAEPIDHSLWIVLRLPEQTLILNYQTWGEYEQYVLPGSDRFVIGRTPNSQHLLIRSDGIWSLGGISHPKHIFKMPLEGQIRTFARGADYYVKATTKNSTVVLKARYMGN
ncbi:hypothetical protein DMN91_003660 [Ooceraea biroi]|uniref:Uncharacterized protein n=1 Tax=Ooceraea biroi TaxID=2015173 RepID=A0A3L8DSZ3_OOCBI|nr:hypothetical protein DMN91_003660 [Ooceraea biroi]